MSEGAIRFYGIGGEFGCFSNFPPHPIRLRSRVRPASKHFLQGQEFAGTLREEEIRKAASPMIADRLGRSRKHPLRKDWESVKDGVTREALRAEFDRQESLRAILQETGDRRTAEHTAYDRYRADGGDGRGWNRLGELPMTLRTDSRTARA